MARVGTRRIGLDGVLAMLRAKQPLTQFSFIPINLDQSVLEGAVLVSNHYTSSNTQISIKPGVPDTTTVQLNTNFKVSSLFFLRDRLNLQTRGVGMGTNDGNTVSRLVLFTNGKSNHGATITSKVVFTTTLDLSIIPAITLLDFSESGLNTVV
jgi:hypothetical protein